MRFLLVIFISLGIYCKTLSAQDSLAPTEKPKKYKLSICAVFKNEAKFLKEWIEYHRLVGVDHFYLYNLGSSDSYMKVLTPYLKTKLVTLIQWPDRVGDQDQHQMFLWALGTQVPAYENAAKYVAVNETTWLAFIDVNEFLISPPTGKVTEILEKYNSPGITLSCISFDASEEPLSAKKLLIETLKLTKPPEKNPQREISKIIFKPDLCLGFTWPPYQCIFKDHKEALAVQKSELRINHYVNRNVGSFFRKIKDKLHIDNRLFTEEEMASYLAQDYEIEDQERIIYRYVPELQKRMGQSPLWGW